MRCSDNDDDDENGDDRHHDDHHDNHDHDDNGDLTKSAGGAVQCSQLAGGNITIMESNQPTVRLICIFVCISI